MSNIEEYKTTHIVKEELILKIFVIGYSPMGESIVILVMADNIVKFSAVIDCFESSTTNLTLDILKEYNIEELNLICLTHPDKDQCKGLEKVLEKINSKTKILYPTNVFNDSYKDKSVEIAVDKIGELLALRKDDSNKPILKGCAGNNLIQTMEFQHETNGYRYPLYINTYSPVSEINDRYSAKNFLKGENIYHNAHNNLSIMSSLSLGDFKVLLCSDIENDSIDIVKRDLNQNGRDFFSYAIDFFKIPHHCSNGSKNILNLLKNIFVPTSVTTVYRVGNVSLPDKQMLEKYKAKLDTIYCTSNIKENENKYGYGIVEVTVNIFNRTIKIEDMHYDSVQIK